MKEEFLKNSGRINRDFFRDLFRTKQSECTREYPLSKVGQVSQAGIWRAGGTSLEFGHIAPCEEFENGNPRMHYIFPSWETIAAEIKIIVESNQIDNIVAVSSYNKVVSAYLMALAHINLPSHIVTGGIMLAGDF